jgi:Fe-S cluster biogenesis protein NfuA
MDNNDFQARTQQVERLLQRVNALADENARATALELLQAVMDLHGAAMSRIVELLSGSEAYRAPLLRLATDPLVCGLLVLYGIHPMALSERMAQAIDKLRPQLQKHGASVELLEIADDAVRVKVQTRAPGLAAALEKITQAVEQSILEAAPEVTRVSIEGVAPSGFVPLNQLQTVTKEKAYEESAT